MVYRRLDGIGEEGGEELRGVAVELFYLGSVLFDFDV